MKRHICVAAIVLCIVASLTGTVSARAQPNSSDKAAIEANYRKFADAFDKKDVNGIMMLFAPDVFVYDVIPPRQYTSADAYRKDWEDTFAAFPGPVTTNVTDLNITVAGSVAYTRYVIDGTMTDKDGKAERLVVRSTDVWRKINGKWLIVQEHNSFPVDLTTGQADLLSKP
jgi:uncharacterized protein (TIGR02246 family)